MLQSDTDDSKFQKFSDKDWICKNFFRYGSGVKNTISAHLCWIVSLKLDPPIQKLISDGNRIRISETLLSIFQGFRHFLKKLHIAH